VLKDRIHDPEGLLKWMGNDRAQIVFRHHADIQVKEKAVQAIISAWIKLV
jgi:hypothetical protein